MSEPISYELTPVDPAALRPSVEDVARLIRARTKDDVGDEVGTFTEDTRPTADQVEDHITTALALVGTRLPPPERLDAVFGSAVAALVAYRAALQIEKSYFPEQVRSDRSAYEQLRQEYLDDLAALTEAIAEAGGGGASATKSGAWSEWTPTFLRVFGTGFPLDYWPEPENPQNWRASPYQPPREPPLPEDLPVGDRPTRGVGDPPLRPPRPPRPLGSRWRT